MSYYGTLVGQWVSLEHRHGLEPFFCYEYFNVCICIYYVIKFVILNISYGIKSTEVLVNTTVDEHQITSVHFSDKNVTF